MQNLFSWVGESICILELTNKNVYTLVANTRDQVKTTLDTIAESTSANNSVGWTPLFEENIDEYTKLYNFIVYSTATPQPYFIWNNISFNEFCYVIRKKFNDSDKFYLSLADKIDTDLETHIYTYLTSQDEEKISTTKATILNKQEKIAYIKIQIKNLEKKHDGAKTHFIIKNPSLEEYTLLKELFPALLVYFDLHDPAAMHTAAKIGELSR